jgi:SulP family sulfate permease
MAERLRATGRTLLLCGARSQPDQLLRQSDFLQFLGAENMLPHVEAALSRAREIHEGRSANPRQVTPESRCPKKQCPKNS